MRAVSLPLPGLPEVQYGANLALACWTLTMPWEEGCSYYWSFLICPEQCVFLTNRIFFSLLKDVYLFYIHGCFVFIVYILRVCLVPVKAKRECQIYHVGARNQTQALCKISSGLNCLANWTVPKALLTNKHFSPFRCKHLDKICPYLPSAFLSLVHNNH